MFMKPDSLSLSCCVFSFRFISLFLCLLLFNSGSPTRVLLCISCVRPRPQSVWMPLPPPPPPPLPPPPSLWPLPPPPPSSKREEGAPLFADDGWSQDDDNPGVDGDQHAPAHGHAYGSGSGSGSGGRGTDGRGREPPSLLRYSLLATPAPAPTLTPTATPTSTASTAPRSRSGRRATTSADESTVSAKPKRADRKRGPSTAAAGPMLPPPPRAGGVVGGARGRNDSGGGSDGATYLRERSLSGGGGGHSGGGSGDAIGGPNCGVRSGGGGQVERERGLGLSAASVGSVDGELRGAELERVRGRVADLGAAIETSQVRCGCAWVETMGRCG